MIMSTKVSIVLLTTLSLFAVGCSKDPQVAKKEYFDKGNTYFEQKKYPEAIIEYRNAIQQDPQYGEARLKLAEAYTYTRDARNALFEYTRAAALLPKDNEAQLKAGALLLLAQKFEDAKARADQVLANDPKHIDAQILKANALAGLKDMDGAIKEMEEAIQLDPDESRAYGVLGALQMARGNREEARAGFEKAVALDPKSVNARLALANYLWATNQPAAAEKSLQDAITLEPNDVRANRALAAFYLASGRAAEAEKPLKTVVEADKTGVASRLALADYYILHKREQEARPLLTALVQDKQGFAEAQRRLAALDFAGGQRESGHRLIDEVLGRESKNPEALLLKGRFLLADKKTDEALTKIQAAIDADPKFAAGHYLLGTVYASRQQNDQAIDAFKRVLEINPGAVVGAQMQLAQLTLAAGDGKGALSYAEAAAKSQPGNPGPQLLLAKILVSQNQPEKAEAILNDLAQKFPKAAIPHIQLGALHFQKKDSVGARRAFERALALEPDSGEALAGVAALDLSEKKPQDALARIEKKLQATPDNPNLLILAAQIHAATGDTSKAEQILRKVLEVAPDRLEPFGLLAQIYLRQGKLDQARQEFEQLAQKNPTNAGAPTMVATIFQAQNKVADARQWYEKALQINPRAAVAANNLAWLLAENGQDLAAALQYAKQAQAVLPEQPDISDTVGWIYYKQDNAPLAIREFRQSIAKNAQNPIYHYHLGMAYLKAGEKDRAKQSLQEALRLSPDFPQAADAKSQLSTL